MKTGKEILDAYNTQSNNFENISSFVTLEQMIDNELEKLQSIIQAGYDLSAYAAAINWQGGSNTKEWLGDLRDMIENYQEIVKTVGVGAYTK